MSKKIGFMVVPTPKEKKEFAPPPTWNNNGSYNWRCHIPHLQCSECGKRFDTLPELVKHEEEECYIHQEIIKLRAELDAIPIKKRVALGSKGLIILSKIHKLKCQLEEI